MPNRFERRRRTAIALGCVFCCIAGALALTGGVQAAMISAEIAATGTQFMAGDSSLVWQVSNSNNTGLPLVCGQEVVIGSVGDSFLTGHGGKYNSGVGLQNGDLILTQVQRQVSSTGPAAYSESLVYEGYGAGQPEGGCDINGETPASGSNETIPAIDPYCSAFRISTGLIGSGLTYQSAGGIVSGSTDSPDSAGFQFAGAGNGMGSVSVGSFSQTPWTKNQFSQSMITGGKLFTISGKFQFTSFAQTFDHPTAEG